MRSVNSEIVQLRDQQELFPKITQLIQSTFKFYFVALYTADGTTGRITYRSSAGKALSKEQIRELAGPGGIAFGDRSGGNLRAERAGDLRAGPGTGQPVCNGERA